MFCSFHLPPVPTYCYLIYSLYMSCYANLFINHKLVIKWPLTAKDSILGAEVEFFVAVVFVSELQLSLFATPIANNRFHL